LTDDPAVKLLRVVRIVSAIDVGRILNEKLARSQTSGATVMGIGMMMPEETIIDPGTGRIGNATFGDYLIRSAPTCPTSMSCSPATPMSFSPVRVKGLGEIGVVSVSRPMR
jgi:CO/xanthine dehydrogenase Mo-binding subunit